MLLQVLLLPGCCTIPCSSGSPPARGRDTTLVVPTSSKIQGLPTCLKHSRGIESLQGMPTKPSAGARASPPLHCALQSSGIKPSKRSLGEGRVASALPTSENSGMCARESWWRPWSCFLLGCCFIAAFGALRLLIYCYVNSSC